MMKLKLSNFCSPTKVKENYFFIVCIATLTQKTASETASCDDEQRKHRSTGTKRQRDEMVDACIPTSHLSTKQTTNKFFRFSLIKCIFRDTMKDEFYFLVQTDGWWWSTFFSCSACIFLFLCVCKVLQTDWLAGSLSLYFIPNQMGGGVAWRWRFLLRRRRRSWRRKEWVHVYIAFNTKKKLLRKGLVDLKKSISSVWQRTYAGTWQRKKNVEKQVRKKSTSSFVYIWRACECIYTACTAHVRRKKIRDEGWRQFGWKCRRRKTKSKTIP